MTADPAGTYRVMVTGWQTDGSSSQYVSRTKEFTVSAEPFTVMLTPNATWTVRCMTASSLERKCDIQAYIQKVRRSGIV